VKVSLSIKVVLSFSPKLHYCILWHTNQAILIAVFYYLASV